MANERRVRFDFVAGGLSVALVAGDTTLQSNGLQDLPALLTDEFCMACLFTVDNLGRVTKKEIIKITAHSAAAGSATIVRGQLGTTAQGWSIGDRWSLSDLSDDNLVICTTATRPSAPYEGLTIYDRTTGRTHWWNGSNWILEDNLRMLGAGSVVGGAVPAIDTGSVPFKVQMGTFVGATDASGYVTFNFPVAFPNGVCSVLVMQGDQTHAGATFCITTTTVSSVTYRMFTTTGASWNSSGNHRISWIAIGW